MEVITKDVRLSRYVKNAFALLENRMGSKWVKLGAWAIGAEAHSLIKGRVTEVENTAEVDELFKEIIEEVEDKYIAWHRRPNGVGYRNIDGPYIIEYSYFILNGKS